MTYNPETQQRVGKVVNILLIGIALFALSTCFRKSTDERMMDCFVKEMKGQGEHMKEAVVYKCQQKTGYNKQK
jgi:hypothetical protein